MMANPNEVCLENYLLKRHHFYGCANLHSNQQISRKNIR